MGAQQSSTKMEAADGGAEKKVVPVDDLVPLPRLQRQETFEEKLYRKVNMSKADPILACFGL